MAEKDKVYSSKIKYEGVFDFKAFYKFCHQWLTEETSLSVTEEEYSEKIKGDAKEIDVKWKGKKDISDYFGFETGVSFKILNLKNVEVNQGGRKIKSNEGSVELKMTSNIVRDPQGKFETTPFMKFVRGIYEKWVINARISEIEEKIDGDSDKFLTQAKAWLDLEGKK